MYVDDTDIVYTVLTPERSYSGNEGRTQRFKRLTLNLGLVPENWGLFAEIRDTI